jgi:hypothetical protein
MKKQVRTLFSTMRSGSTLVLHCLSQHPNITCISGTIKKSPTLKAETISNSWQKVLSWEHENDFLFVKNTYDKNIYYPFPDSAIIPLVKPVFLFRDPVQTINSIILKRFMNSNLEDAIKAYKEGAFASYIKTKNLSPNNTRCITYETLTERPEQVFTKLLSFWGIPWHPNVINWQETFSERTFRHDIKTHQNDIKNAIQDNHHDTLMKSTQIMPQHVKKIILSGHDVDLIKTELQDLYNQVKSDELTNEKN